MTLLDERRQIAAPAPTVAPPRTKDRRGWMAMLAAAPPTALVALHATRYGHWLVDDAGITFAYARSLADGAGPVLQPGADPDRSRLEPGLDRDPRGREMARALRHRHLVRRPRSRAVPEAGGAALRLRHVLLLLLAWSPPSAPGTSRSSRSPPGLATALVPSFVIWTMSGLENSLFALAVVALAATLVRAAQAGRMLTTRTAVVCGAVGRARRADPARRAHLRGGLSRSRCSCCIAVPAEPQPG